VDRCPLDALARVLASLLARPVSPDQVRDRAVGFGLLRLAGAGAGTELTAQTASRLLLAGYHLPAQVEAAGWAEVRKHLAENRHAFLLLGGAAAERRDGAGSLVPVLQALGLPPEDGAGSWLLATEPGSPSANAQRLSLDWTGAAWAAAGNLLVAAARRWADLPTHGRTFFAGSRDRDGTYHWNSAECDTDGEGNILRH
jgi:hypothetical protein